MKSFLKIYTDGGARGNPGPGAAAFVVVEAGRVIFKGSRFLGKTTNNKAEYNGVIMALAWLLNNKSAAANKDVFIFLDSQLIARQLGGFYKIKSENLKPLVKRIKSLLKKIPVNVNYSTVPREKNRLADAIVNKEIDENI